MVKEIRWPGIAQKQLLKAYLYILQFSLQNAEKVKNDILSSTNKIAENPERYPPDKFKLNNDGSFRAYEIHHYRIAYQIKEKEIIILRIRHTSMEPKPY